MSHAMTHGTRSTSSSSFSSVPGLIPPRSLITSVTPYADPRKAQEGGIYPELHPHTGYEPNRIVGDQDNTYFTEDDQITELEDRTTKDSVESIATPPEADVDDEQLRTLLASPLYLQERGTSAERSQVYHSEREILMSSSSQDPKPGGTGKPVAEFSSQSELNQDTFSDRDQFSLKHQQVLGVMNLSSDSTTRQKLRNLFLEYKVESLDNCTDELQQQTCAQRLELQDAHHGYVESRREQVQLQENQQ